MDEHQLDTTGWQEVDGHLALTTYGMPTVTDDIVTRLRNGPDGIGWSCDFASEARLIEEAADEIERLRADLAEAYDACRYALADSPRWEALAETVVATWEAHRG